MPRFTHIVQRDHTTGMLVGHISGWPHAHSQGSTIEELRSNLGEVLSMLLQDGGLAPEFESSAPSWDDGRVEDSIPALKPTDVAAALQLLGFKEEFNRELSHRQYKHSDGRKTKLPFQQDRVIAPSLLKAIARDIGLEPHQLVESAPQSRPRIGNA